MAEYIGCADCGRSLAGSLSVPKKINGKYQCRACAPAPKVRPSAPAELDNSAPYTCGACGKKAHSAGSRGNKWVAGGLFVLWLVISTASGQNAAGSLLSTVVLIAAVVYTVWAVYSPANTCPGCKAPALQVNDLAKQGKYHCTACDWYSSAPAMKGSPWISFFLLCLGLLPGLIYMVWRRTNPKSNCCPKCGVSGMSPPKIARAFAVDEKACPECAEPILKAAKKCKHCGASVTPE